MSQKSDTTPLSFTTYLEATERNVLPEGRAPKAPAFYSAVFTGDYPIEPKDMLEQGFELKAAE